MGKVVFVVGFGVGYVLGARAGRQRYEQLARWGRQLRDHPAVQTTAGLVGGQASDFVARLRDHAGHSLHLGDAAASNGVLHGGRG